MVIGECGLKRKVYGYTPSTISLSTCKETQYDIRWNAVACIYTLIVTLKLMTDTLVIMMLKYCTIFDGKMQ